MPLRAAHFCSSCILPLSYCALANGQDELVHSITTSFPLNSASVRLCFDESITSKAGAGLPTEAWAFGVDAAKAIRENASEPTADAKKVRLVFIAILHPNTSLPCNRARRRMSTDCLERLKFRQFLANARAE